MSAQPERNDEQSWNGGAQYVDQDAGDRPGPHRGPGLLLIAVLGLVALGMPVAWGVGLIAGLSDVLPAAALVGLWVVWGIVVVLFIWSVWSIWRRSA